MDVSESPLNARLACPRKQKGCLLLAGCAEDVLDACHYYALMHWLNTIRNDHGHSVSPLSIRVKTVSGSS